MRGLLKKTFRGLPFCAEGVMAYLMEFPSDPACVGTHLTASLSPRPLQQWSVVLPLWNFLPGPTCSYTLTETCPFSTLSIPFPPVILSGCIVKKNTVV